MHPSQLKKKMPCPGKELLKVKVGVPSKEGMPSLKRESTGKPSPICTAI